MYYQLRITAFRDRHARTVIARHLSQDLNIPFQTAVSMTERLPLMLGGNFDVAAAQSRIRQFAKVGIEAESVAVEADSSLVDVSPPDRAPREHSRDDDPQPVSIIASVKNVTKPERELEQADLPEVVEAAPRGKRATARVRALIAAVGLIAVVAVVLLLIPRLPGHILGGNGGPAAEERSAALPRTTERLPQVNDPGGVPVDTVQPPGRESIERSQGYVDSAQAHPDDLDGVIRFYKMAIAFNPGNRHAWHGLLAAYRSAGKNVDAQELETRIRERFGENPSNEP
jgi:hypothetical protein